MIKTGRLLKKTNAYFPKSRKMRIIVSGIALTITTGILVLALLPIHDNVRHDATNTHSGQSAASATKKIAPVSDHNATPDQQSTTSQDASADQSAASSSTPVPTTPKPAATANPAPTAPVVPLPFGISGATMRNAASCFDANYSSDTRISIQDIAVSLRSTSSGTLSYWLESSGLTTLRGEDYKYVYTIPAGTWNTTLLALKYGTSVTPHEIYTFDVFGYQGQGAVRVVMQAGSDYWYSDWFTVPATNPC